MWEFNAAYKKCGNDMEKLVILCCNLKEGAVACLDGNWKTCRRASLVCQAHKRGWKGKKCWVSLKSWWFLLVPLTVSCYIMHFYFQDQKLLLCKIQLILNQRLSFSFLSFQVTSGQRIEWSKEDKRSVLQKDWQQTGRVSCKGPKTQHHHERIVRSRKHCKTRKNLRMPLANH